MSGLVRLVGCHDKEKAAVGGFCEVIAEDISLKEAQKLYKDNKDKYAGGCWPESMSTLIVTEKDIAEAILSL